MTDIRIVCARDAVATAETLRRLLEAEQHLVEISIGRHSLDQFEHARRTGEVVVLIWSANAPGAHYMFEWAGAFEAKRLIEIASEPGWPDLRRTAPVIDFASWNGTRGGKAWLALRDRLKPFLRVREAKPTQQPRRAAMALGFAAAAAMVGAVVVRVHAGGESTQASAEPDALHVVPSGGVGGPFESSPSQAIEPPSAGDTAFVPRRISLGHLPHFDPIQDVQLTDLPELETVDLHHPSLLERIGELNPFRAHEPDGE